LRVVDTMVVESERCRAKPSDSSGVVPPIRYPLDAAPETWRYQNLETAPEPRPANSSPQGRATASHGWVGTTQELLAKIQSEATNQRQNSTDCCSAKKIKILIFLSKKFFPTKNKFLQSRKSTFSYFNRLSAPLLLARLSNN
jgi:CO dehydrogenase/acetyl-CoA synthase alpha subunit